MTEKGLQKLEEFRQGIERFSRKNKKTSYLYDFVERYIELVMNGNQFAATFLAYYLILSFIPMVIFISQILGMVNESFDDILFQWLVYLPKSSAELLSSLLESMIGIRNTGLSVLAALSWLWLGSSGFEGLVKMINEVFGTKNPPNFILSRLLGLLAMLGFIVISAVLLLFNVFDDAIITFIQTYTPLTSIFPHLMDGIHFTFKVIGHFAPLIFMLIMFTLFFKFIPITTKNHSIYIKDAFFGAFATSIGIILLTLIYAYTQNNLAKTNLYYGSLGGILATLVWLLMVCQAIVYGAQISATIMDLRREKAEAAAKQLTAAPENTDK